MRFRILALAALLVCAPATSAAACRTSVLGLFVGAEGSYLLGVPPGSTVRAPGAEPPRFAGPVRIPDSASAGDSLRGWIVRVEEAAGRAGDELSPGASEVVLVPWVYGPDCRPLPWPRDEAWLRPGERGVFSGYLRPRSHRVDGRPVLDVFLAWHQPYPSGEFLEHEVPRRTPPDAPWLSVDEFWSLVRVAAAVSDSPERPDAVRDALRVWMRAHPALAERFPASVMLTRLRLLPPGP